MNLEEPSKPTSKTAINQGRAVRGIGFLYNRPLILVNLGGLEGRAQREAGNRIGCLGALGRAWLSEPAVEQDEVWSSTGERTARRAVPTQGSPKPIIRSPIEICLQVGPSIRARPRPAKDRQPYPMQCCPYLRYTSWPLHSVPRIGGLSIRPIGCIGFIDARTFRRCGKLCEINFATCTRDLAGHAG
jgi:hypothetical protein